MDERMLAIAVLAIISLTILIVKLGLRPLHWAGRMLVHLVVGAFLLFLLNAIGGMFAFHIPLNMVTVAIAGVLGLPGVIALVCIQLFII